MGKNYGAATGLDDQNLILLSFVSSKPFSDWKSVKISRTALYDNFEIFQKKFNREEFSKIEGQFAKFQPIFNLKTVLNSQKIGESGFNRRGR